MNNSENTKQKLIIVSNRLPVSVLHASNNTSDNQKFVYKASPGVLHQL